MKTRELLAMRRTDITRLTELLAYNAVRRGIRWLDRHAPVGWYRNLFEPLPEGRSRFRADDRDNITSVLALSFEPQAEFADELGYVQQFRVASKFGLTFRDQLLYGFNAGWAYQNRERFFGEEQRVRITSAMLNKAWEEALSNLDRFSPYHRYRTPEEELSWSRLRNVDFLAPPKKPGIIERLRARLAA